LSSRCHTSGSEGERLSGLRKEKLLATTRILESFGEFRRVDSNTTRLLIAEVPFEVPSIVSVRSLEHVPMSRQKDKDALESMRSASGNAKAVGLHTPISLNLDLKELQRLRAHLYQLVLRLVRSRFEA